MSLGINLLLQLIQSNSRIGTMIDLITSFIFTWGLGLVIPYLVRYKVHKKQLKRRYTVPLVIFIFLFQVIISILIHEYAGDGRSPSGALILVAFVNYLILRRKNQDKNLDLK